MPTLTVTAKGQITLRREVLRHLGVGPGERVEVDLLPDGQAVLRGRAPGRVADLFGLFAGRAARTVSVEEMNEAAADGWAGRR
ncbi:MAG: AbrB/MazE/SpoVT family DNA-binding domain-containing protein [Propionibacteriaceae bacterium]|nr:AbrB/MazE/SpoVT family DNA-binding domain-containing protein [Propionibacteriaceae bacterium]